MSWRAGAYGTTVAGPAKAFVNRYKNSCPS